MKVLFLSTWFPYPPDNGARNRVYNLLKALGKRHEVHLISLLQEDTSEDDVTALECICRPRSVHKMEWFRPSSLRTVLGLFSSRPRSFVEAHDPVVARAVSQAIEELQPEVVIASQMLMADYIPEDAAIPSVLEEHHCWTATLRRSAGMQHSLYKRLRHHVGWRKFARWEAHVCRAFDVVTEVSEEDRVSLLRVAPDLQDVRVVPNGVDVDYFDPGTWRPETNMLLYNGALTYGANLDAIQYFAAEIYPLLRQSCPDAVLRVTGKATGVDLRGVDDCPGVQLTGYVEDIRNVLATSAACVVPLRVGGGTRLKILEAMAAGVPVVSTSMGAEGLGVVADNHLLIANTPVDIVAAVRRVLEDQDLARSLSVNGRALVEEHYSWSSIGERFARIVESTAQRRTSKAADGSQGRGHSPDSGMNVHAV